MFDLSHRILGASRAGNNCMLAGVARTFLLFFKEGQHRVELLLRGETVQLLVDHLLSPLPGDVLAQFLLKFQQHCAVGDLLPQVKCLQISDDQL